MRLYQQLTQPQRYRLSGFIQDGLSLTAIARILKCHKSTISREIKRNSTDGIYRPVSAHHHALARRHDIPRHTTWTLDMMAHVIGKLQKRWSPQQIIAWSKKHHVECVSHESIYHFIWKDKKQGGTLYKYLRHCGKKRKNYTGIKETRGRFNHAPSIDERPKEVEKRDVFGHVEADLMIGKERGSALLTLVDRKLRYIWAKTLPNKSEAGVTAAIISALSSVKDLILSITFDRGKEFSGYKEIAEALDAQMYFAHPYSSWERGTNENSNGLLRQYFPKRKTDFKKINDETLAAVLSEINSRPRRCLDFNNAADLLSEELESRA